MDCHTMEHHEQYSDFAASCKALSHEMALLIAFLTLGLSEGLNLSMTFSSVIKVTKVVSAGSKTILSGDTGCSSLVLIDNVLDLLL
jgi:hypothetical protein